MKCHMNKWQTLELVLRSQSTIKWYQQSERSVTWRRLMNRLLEAGFGGSLRSDSSSPLTEDHRWFSAPNLPPQTADRFESTDWDLLSCCRQCTSQHTLLSHSRGQGNCFDSSLQRCQRRELKSKLEQLSMQTKAWQTCVCLSTRAPVCHLHQRT